LISECFFFFFFFFSFLFYFFFYFFLFSFLIFFNSFLFNMTILILHDIKFDLKLQNNLQFYSKKLWLNQKLET
jgi:hypothetical protein